MRPDRDLAFLKLSAAGRAVLSRPFGVGRRNFARVIRIKADRRLLTADRFIKGVRCLQIRYK